MATPAPLIRTLRPYSVGNDFALWICRFEAYARAVRIPYDKLSDALLALLDDAAFRAFDLLGLPEETVKDYKRLVDTLKKRFVPGAGQQELRFLLGQRVQEAGEMLDGFADVLILNFMLLLLNCFPHPLVEYTPLLFLVHSLRTALIDSLLLVYKALGGEPRPTASLRDL